MTLPDMQLKPDKVTHTALLIIHLCIMFTTGTVSTGASAQTNPTLAKQALLLREFIASDANQAVAIDENHFFAINNQSVSQFRQESGNLVQQWSTRSSDIVLRHLDSGLIQDNKLYCAHSNYPQSPMQNSVEVWAADTLEHIASYPLKINNGSMTWLDFHNGNWWAGFGNYDIVPEGQQEAYGKTENSYIARLDENFNISQRWQFPPELYELFKPMSNSGASWGNDNLLYLSGHDREQVYVVSLPADAAEVLWRATLSLPGFAGQGIAWNRSNNDRELWTIHRAERKIRVYSIPEL